MDILKKIISFSFLSDLMFFDKESKVNNEVELVNKVYRASGLITFYALCVLAVFYGLFLIPLINVVTAFIFAILFSFFILGILIWTIAKSIILFFGFKRINIDKYSNEKKKYLEIMKVNIFLSVLVYSLVLISFILIGIGVYGLASFLFLALGIILIVKLVYYVISRFKVYQVIKSNEY